MCSTYPYWDVSYLVATIFTLGSVVWVINAFFAWLPLEDPSTEFKNESSLGGGITALIGATIFEVGSVLLMIEAVNENRSECFGWALEEALEERGILIRVRPMTGCAHHHKNKGNLVGKGKVEEGEFQLCSCCQIYLYTIYMPEKCNIWRACINFLKLYQHTYISNNTTNIRR